MPNNAPTLLDKIDNWIVRILKWISYVSAVCLIAIMLVAFINAVGEKLRQAGLPTSGIPASTEIIQYLHIPVAFLAAAYVTMDRGHTKVDLVSARLPKALQNVFAIIGNLLGAGICGLVSWRAFVQMGKFIARHKMSSVSGVGFPLWPFALITGLAFAMLAVSFLWDIVRKFVLKKGSSAPNPANGGDQ